MLPRSKPLVAALAALTTQLTLTAQQFDPQVRLGTYSAGRSPHLVDIDGDGDLDLLYLRTSQGDIVSLENLGHGGFAIDTVVFNGAVPFSSMALLDVDGDGLDDAILTSSQNAPLRWVRANGTGGFGLDTSFGATLSGRDLVAVGDVNGDGRDDVLWVTTTGMLGWNENQGGSVFADATPFSTGMTSLRSLELADLNGDGSLDVVLTSNTLDRVAWFANDGTGGFGPQLTVTNGADGAYDAAPVDLDGDGDLDLLVASETSDRVEWFRNNGSGTFGPASLIDGAADGVRDVAALDVNLDGVMDVIAASFTGNQVTLYLGVGMGFFGVPIALTGAGPLAAPGASEILVGDLDGDCDIDIVSGAVNSASFYGYYDNSQLGSIECTSPANSTGLEAKLALTGSPVVTTNCVVLTAQDLPPSVFGFFVSSMTAGNVPNTGGGEGTLCLGGAIGRYTGPGEILFSGAERSIRLQVDLAHTPTPSAFVAITAGQTWRFQAWHRDTVGGAASSNFSNSIAVLFR